jgi:hypothetical protein
MSSLGEGNTAGLLVEGCVQTTCVARRSRDTRQQPRPRHNPTAHFGREQGFADDMFLEFCQYTLLCGMMSEKVLD